MAYTSDLRVKNVLKDIHLELIDELQKHGIHEHPDLRIFDESNEDNIDFDAGGLTFLDPESNHKYGSNDAAWVYKDKPLVVVEGTFGTERGQFGDGQLNRFSHSLGVARNGSIGVTFVPLKGESYSKSGSQFPNLSNLIKLKYAHMHKGFLLGAVNINEIESGSFLVIDAYDTSKLKKLILESFKKALGIENQLERIVKIIIEDMQHIVKDYDYGKQSKGLISSFWSAENKIISNFSRAYTQNFAALTESSKRDGHGLFGKCLLESYISGQERYYAIFLRLSKDDVDKLMIRRQKEFTFISSSKQISVVSFDDLQFNNQSQKVKLKEIRNLNLFRNRQDAFLKEIQKSINAGDICLKTL